MSMETAHIVIRLWDYGWLHHDRVKLPTAASDTDVIERYVGSPAFHTSFLPNERDETGIHGPFVAERIKAADFLPLQNAELGSYLKSVELSDLPGEDATERAKASSYLRAAFDGGHMCYVLRRDERNSELFHEWGSVFFLFREFLFIGSERDCVERFVIGCD